MEKKNNFWEIAVSGLVGTAVGYVISYYVNDSKKSRLDEYLDRTINFLEDVKDRRQSSDYSKK